MNALLEYANMVAGAAILYHAVSVVSAMSRRTRHGIRAAFVLIAAGALALLTEPWLPKDMPLDGGQVLAFGVAVLLVFDRRDKVLPLPR